MKRNGRLESMLYATHAVLSENGYVVLILVMMLLFGTSYAILPLLLIPGARLSLSSVMNSFSTLDLVLLASISILFGVVTAIQVYEIRRLSKGIKAEQGGSLMATVVGILVAKSCCILPLILLMLGSLSAALLVSSHLTEIRLLGAGVMGTVFVITANRVGNGLRSASAAEPESDGAGPSGVCPHHRAP